MRVFIFALLVSALSQLCFAYSFVTFGVGPTEQRTSYTQYTQTNPKPVNDITMVGMRWQMTIGGSTNLGEWYGQFRMFEPRREHVTHITSSDQGYQTLSVTHWQWDRALVCGYRHYLTPSRRVTTLLGGGVLLGLGRGHQSEHQTTTIIHEDHSRETADDFTNEYKLEGLKAGFFVDIGSRFKLSKYLFFEALYEFGASGLGTVGIFPESRFDDHEKSLHSVVESSFMFNLRWDFGRALER